MLQFIHDIWHLSCERELKALFSDLIIVAALMGEQQWVGKQWYQNWVFTVLSQAAYWWILKLILQLNYLFPWSMISVSTTGGLPFPHTIKQPCRSLNTFSSFVSHDISKAYFTSPTVLTYSLLLWVNFYICSHNVCKVLCWRFIWKVAGINNSWKFRGTWLMISLQGVFLSSLLPRITNGKWSLIKNNKKNTFLKIGSPDARRTSPLQLKTGSFTVVHALLGWFSF